MKKEKKRNTFKQSRSGFKKLLEKDSYKSYSESYSESSSEAKRASREPKVPTWKESSQNCSMHQKPYSFEDGSGRDKEDKRKTQYGENSNERKKQYGEKINERKEQYS